MRNSARIIVGDNRDLLQKLPRNSVQTCITSPPYWGLRDYGMNDQIGLEQTFDDYVQKLVDVFRDVWDVLADDGTLWLNLGDTYFNKQLLGIPWRVAFALQADGWILRSDIIWNKPNPMPESVNNRPSKCHEHIFLLAKSFDYFFDNEAIKETANPMYMDRYKYGFGGKKTMELQNQGFGNMRLVGFREFNGKRNKRDVWTIPVQSYAGAHFATYPPELILPCVLAGSRENDIVLDPFSGSGTTGEVALQNGRNYVGLELNPDYAALSYDRISNAVGLFGDVVLEHGIEAA